jgi:hypothetical protein
VEPALPLPCALSTGPMHFVGQCVGGSDDERLVPDLLRGRGMPIGGDLDVGEEGSKQTIITLQSLHHGYIGYQHTHT